MANNLDMGKQPKQCQELHQCRIIYYIMQAVERVHNDPHHMVMEVCNIPFSAQITLFENVLSNVTNADILL